MRAQTQTQSWHSQTYIEILFPVYPHSQQYILLKEKTKIEIHTITFGSRCDLLRTIMMRQKCIFPIQYCLLQLFQFQLSKIMKLSLNFQRLTINLCLPKFSVQDDPHWTHKPPKHKLTKQKFIRKQNNRKALKKLRSSNYYTHTFKTSSQENESIIEKQIIQIRHSDPAR